LLIKIGGRDCCAAAAAAAAVTILFLNNSGKHILNSFVDPVVDFFTFGSNDFGMLGSFICSDIFRNFQKHVPHVRNGSLGWQRRGGGRKNAN